MLMSSNASTNGWMHGHYISIVLIFAPDGTIVAVCLNCPGSFHDLEVCTLGGLYDPLYETHLLCGGKCVMDSAFSAAGRPYVAKSSQNLNQRVLDPEERERKRQAMSQREMGDLKGPFQ